MYSTRRGRGGEGRREGEARGKSGKDKTKQDKVKYNNLWGEMNDWFSYDTLLLYILLLYIYEFIEEALALAFFWWCKH